MNRNNDNSIAGFWIGVVVAAPILLITLFLSGAGHGTYIPVKIFFPITMLSTLVFKTITIPFIVIAVIQFPVYGLLMGYWRQHHHSGVLRNIVLYLHLILTILALWLT